MQAAIEFENVSFSYGQASVLENINLSISEEEFFGLIGPNAGGKSTMLKLLLGLLEPDHGMVSIFGKSPKKFRSRVGYVPQYPTYSRNFPINVEDVVMLGRVGITSAIGRFRKIDKENARRALRAAPEHSARSGFRSAG